MSKIYGIIPIGGKGLRLGLPFPKELLPQKGFDCYKPMVNMTIDKMAEAGVDHVVFIHGEKYKKQFVDLFKGSFFKHIKQEKACPHLMLKDFYVQLKPSDDDKIVFGFGDAVYNGNPYKKMLNTNGVVCGLFYGSDDLNLDRLKNKDDGQFDIKAVKNNHNSPLFWGTLKFDGRDLCEISKLDVVDGDIGHILNSLNNKTMVSFDDYIDIGSWNGYNKYLKNFSITPYNYNTASRH